MERYKIVEGSQSAHCCFEFTIVDTTKLQFPQLGENSGFEPVCECFEEEHAKLICEALNQK